MSKTDDIYSLPGYSELQHAAANALGARQSQTSTWKFEVDCDVKLQNLQRDHVRGSSPTAWSGHDILQGLVCGRYHEAVDQMEEQWHSGGHYDLDRQWRDDELKKVLTRDLEADVEAFGEMNNLDADEVVAALLADDEIGLEDRAHHSVFRFQGYVNIKVDLNVTAGLQPSVHQISGLAKLGISPQEWLAAIESSLECDPIEDEDQFADLLNVGNLDDYRQSFAKCMTQAAAAANIFLPCDSNRRLISAEKLVALYRDEWNHYTGDLHVIFKIDSDHIVGASRDVSRLVSGSEALDAVGINVSGAQIVPADGVESIEGVDLERPIVCQLADFRITNSDIDMPSVSTSVAGRLSLQAIIESSLHDADEKSMKTKKGSYFATAVGRGYWSEEERSADMEGPVIQALMEKAFKGKSRYELEQAASFYPGLRSYFSRACEELQATETPAILGDRLLHVLTLNSSIPMLSWASSEARIEALWLIDQSADVTLRVDHRQPSSTGPMAIHLAAGLLDLELCQKLADQGADAKATFILPGDANGNKEGVWEIAARQAIANDSGQRNKDIGLAAVSLARWAEYCGAQPIDFEQFGPRGYRIDNWRALAAFNDRDLCARHIERLSERMGHLHSAVDERLHRALHFALCNPCASLAIPLIDKGISLDAPSPDHGSSGLSIREAAENWWANKHRAEDSREELDSILMYAESKAALNLLKRIANAAHTAKPI